MDHLACTLPRRRPYHSWFLVVLMLAAIAAPSQAGSTPSGANSGVTTTGSSVLPLGAAPLGREVRLESTTPNATVNPTTGAILLTAAAQQSLNQSANGLSQSLLTTHPALAGLLSGPASIDLAGVSLAIAIDEFDNLIEEEETIAALAARAKAAILAGTPVALSSGQGTLSIAPPDTPGGTTSAVFVPRGGTPTVLPLSGSLENIANAAGFITAAFAAGIPPQQISLFTAFALAGVDYQSLVPLFNAVGGLLPSGNGAVAVDPTQLEAAIQAYNDILADSDADTLATLAQNSDFVALGRSLQQLRAAVDF